MLDQAIIIAAPKEQYLAAFLAGRDKGASEASEPHRVAQIPAQRNDALRFRLYCSDAASRCRGGPIRKMHAA